jgi:hypothetical protein
MGSQAELGNQRVFLFLRFLRSFPSSAWECGAGSSCFLKVGNILKILTEVV